jgi:hypothetical protein
MWENTQRPNGKRVTRYSQINTCYVTPLHASQLASLVFLLRLQLLNVFDEFLEQFARFRSSLPFKFFNDLLLIAKPSEVARRAEFYLRHLAELDHPRKLKFGVLIGHAVQDFITALLPNIEKRNEKLA